MAVCREDGEKAAVRCSAERAEAKLVIQNACQVPRQIEFHLGRSLHPNVGLQRQPLGMITG
jgi:hypothetical protein